tara:strand:+ start:412 stop:612 length:201 start_codon:yes stop_codon:yes gene_type:complete
MDIQTVEQDITHHIEMIVGIIKTDNNAARYFEEQVRAQLDLELIDLKEIDHAETRWLEKFEVGEDE